VVRHFLDRNGIALDDAALADFVAVAVEEGDGILILREPVSFSRLEGGNGEGEHQDGTHGAEREAFTCQLDETALEAGDAEAPGEDGDALPGVSSPEAKFVQRGVDPCVDLQKVLAPR